MAKTMVERMPVPSTGGRILVCSDGTVISTLRGKEYILKPTPDNKGYLRLRVTLDGVKHSYRVHRLVAKAFISNPQNLPQVNHIDGDKTNNDVSNLEWVTNRENAHHAIASGLWDSVLAGARREDERRRIRVIARKGSDELRFNSVKEAEMYFNSRHISDACKGVRNTVNGWRFCYDGR